MTSDALIHKTVRQSNIIIGTLSIIGLIVTIVLVYFTSGPYWLAQLGDPIPMSTKEIAVLDGSWFSHRYNRAISGTDMDDTRYYEETFDEDTGRRIRIDAYFGALELDDDIWILVRHPDEIDNRQEDYVGTIQPITGSVTREVYELSADEMKIDYLPVMLDTTGDETMWYVGTAILAVIGVASIFGLVTALTRISNPHNHPIMKKLTRLGDANEIADHIEGERIMGEEVVDKLRFTRNYMIWRTASTFEAIPLDAVAWIYKLVISGRYGKSYQLHVHDTTGHNIRITAREKQVDAMLAAVYERAPWAITGYNDTIKETWRKNRQGFLSEVDKRRREMKTQP